MTNIEDANSSFKCTSCNTINSLHTAISTPKNISTSSRNWWGVKKNCSESCYEDCKTKFNKCSRLFTIMCRSGDCQQCSYTYNALDIWSKWSRSYIATECLQFNKLEITLKIWPVISTYLYNCYVIYARLFIIGGR